MRGSSCDLCRVCGSLRWTTEVLRRSTDSAQNLPSFYQVRISCLPSSTKFYEVSEPGKFALPERGMLWRLVAPFVAIARSGTCPGFDASVGYESGPVPCAPVKHVISFGFFFDTSRYDMHRHATSVDSIKIVGKATDHPKPMALAPKNY